MNRLLLTLMLAFSGEAHAATWGRLFFNPSERTQIDAPPTAPAAPLPMAPPPPVETKPHRYSGDLSGPRQQIHFVDGQPDGNPPPGIRVGESWQGSQ
ncbi:hypothetical protein ACTSKR_15550 [Chitinibacteraceae bacterium HSL-7]